MSRFEFTTVLVSIVLAFAATEQLTTWGRILREPRRYGFSPTYLAASLWLLLSIVLHWFGLWSYRDVEFDQAYVSFLLLLPSLSLALASYALAPPTDLESGGLSRYWDAISRRILPVFALLMVLSWLTDALIPGVRESAPAAFFVSSAGVFLSGAAIPRTWAPPIAVLANLFASLFVLAVAQA